MVALKGLHVSGYRSIGDVDLDLTALNVLIGPNGSGKSNLISIFDLLGHIVQQELAAFVERAGGADALLRHGPARADAIEIDLDLGAYGYQCRLASAPGQRLIFAHEAVRSPDRRGAGGGVASHVRELGAGHVESLLRSSAGSDPAAQAVLALMRGWGVYHVHQARLAAEFSDAAPPVDEQRAGSTHPSMLRHDGANLAAFLRALRERHPQVYANLVDTVRLVTPSFAAFDLPTDATPAEVRDRPPLRWRERDSGAHFGARALSDGTWRFICLSAALLAPEPPTVIVIDEPELGLHPYAIAVLAGLLRSAATRTQIIVSTQSVTLVNHFCPQDVIVVEARAGRSVFARPDVPALRQWLDEYATGELWEKNLLGGRPG